MRPSPPDSPMSMTDRQIQLAAERLAASWPARPANPPRRRWPCAITELRPQGAACIEVALAIDTPELLAAHARPAQYTTLAYDALPPRFLVLPDVPSAGPQTWRFLVGRDSTLGRALEEHGAVGQKIELSAPEGRGFDISTPEDGALVLFTTGSGIATMRPVLEQLRMRAPTALARTTLYYGVTDPSELAYAEERAAWKAAGCSVHVVIDAPGHQPRYVQHAFAPEAHDPETTRALLSGAPIMVRMVSTTLLRWGMRPERLHTNI